MSFLVSDRMDFGALYQTQHADSVRTTARDVWFFDDGIIHSALVDTQPETAGPAVSTAGSLQSGTNSFLYGRIYIYPPVVDLGNLVSEENRPLHVWNAQFISANVESLVVSGGEGVTLVQPFVTPYTLQPLQEATYTLAVQLDGPAVLNATYEFQVDGQPYDVTVKGIRVVLWPFEPDWAQPVNESLEAFTNIIAADDGSEQRISLRTVQRRRLDYNFHVTRENTQHFSNIMFGWENRAFALPFWQYKCKTLDDTIAGTDLLPVNVVDAGFKIGQTATIMRSIEKFEVIEIEDLPSGFIKFKNAMLFDWPAGSRVFPSAVGKLESNVPVTWQTGRALTGSCAFLCAPVTTDPFLPDAAAPTLYNGYEVITYQHDWSNGVDGNQVHPSDIIDFNTGDINYAVTQLYPSSTKGFRWILKSRLQIRLLRELLKRLNGQQKACYIPSWTQDMQVTAPLSNLATTLTVRDRNFFTLVGANPARAHIMILTKTGERFFRPIASVGKTGDDLQVNITTALGLDLSPADFRGVYYLQLYRQAADRQTIQWLTDQKAIVEQSFVQVPA